MNLQNNSIKMAGLIQEHFDLWNKKILSHLPQKTDELAVQTNAFQCKRGI